MLDIDRYLIQDGCYTDQIAFERWLQKEIGHKVYFDGDDMVDEMSNETIVTFEVPFVTYAEALVQAKDYYGIV